MKKREAHALLFAAALLAACSGDSSNSKSDTDAPASWSGVCVDADHDGFGFQCKKGDDCDDADPELHTDCGCAVAAEGCACKEGTDPVTCVVSREVQQAGSLLCKTGTRYCRDGAWTECIGVRSFELPPPAEGIGQVTQGLIDQDAGAKICTECFPACYQVNDLLQTLPNDPEITLGEHGGLTLAPVTSGSSPESPDEVDPEPTCDPGHIIDEFGQLDDDCDGIPDNYDDDVGAPGETPPFTTTHTAITMDLQPGEGGSNTFELQFVLKTVDVYFLLDTTASMDGELAQLVKDLTTGSFLDDLSTPDVNEEQQVNCASPLGSDVSDNSLKSKGIAGNIACLVPNAGFGAGFFREIPFDNPDSNGLSHAYDWFIPYEHRQDISTSVSDTLSALKLFYTAGNVSWPEDDMYALYAVATGSQIYTGWDRPGTEAKKCSDTSKYFGYPCFRRQAIPVVVLITDASMMNGPDVDIYNNTTLSSCITSAAPFTTTSTSCNSDVVCEAAYPGQGYFCNYDQVGSVLTGKCVQQKPISTACKGGDGPDHANDDSYRQPNDYAPIQTATRSSTPDGLYHELTEAAEDFDSAEPVGTIDDKFITYVGDTRGMAANVHLGNLGSTCSQWPTSGAAAATSDATLGYPDAVFKFHVDSADKTLTISTAGSHHAPTLAIVSATGAGSTTSTTTHKAAPASSDTTPWSFAPSEADGAFDYSITADLSSGFTQDTWRRSAFGACMDGSPGATDYAPDAVFTFRPEFDLDDVSFSVGGALVVQTDNTRANTSGTYSAPLTSGWTNLGTVRGQALTYYGTTAAATAKWTSASWGAADSCRSNATQANYEHVLQFTLDTAASIEIRLNAPASYDPSLSLFGAAPAYPAASLTSASPLTCKHVAGGDEVITGSYAAGTYHVMVHAYSTTNSRGTYTLTVRELTDEAIVLYDAAPSEPDEYAILGPNNVPNSNDSFRSFNIGTIDGRFAVLNAGDTSAPNIHADFVARSFQDATGTCSTVSGLSNDAVVEFSVAQTRKVRIETFDGTGLDPNQSAGFDHAVAVVERPAQLTADVTPVINNDRTDSAYPIAASSITEGVIGYYRQFTGATYGNSNTVPMSESISTLAMYDPTPGSSSATCSAITDGLQDAVFRFDVTQAGTFDFDTAGSASTTYLSLHRGSPDTITVVKPTVTSRVTPTVNDGAASNAPTGLQNGVSLGAVDGKTITYSDATSPTTSNKWTDAQFAGCRINPADNAAHEHVLSFSVTGTKLVDITLTQTAPFDASIALFNGVLTAGATQSAASFKGCSRVSGAPAMVGSLSSAANGRLSASLTTGTYYLLIHGYQSTNSSGSYTVTVADMTSRQANPVDNNDTTADGSATVGGVNLGDVKNSSVSYSGTTSSSTASKWTAALAGTANGATNGCRASASENTTYEHVLYFSVSGTVSRDLSIALTRTGAFEPVISVLTSTGGSPAVNSNLSTRILGCQRAYTPNSPTSKVFSGSPALTAVGHAVNGGTITGTFPPGTYYLIINGASASVNSYGTYNLTITDVSNNAAIPVPKTGGNFTNAQLNSGGTGGTTSGSGDTPYADFGTLSPSGAAYHGTISTSTADKWTGELLGGYTDRNGDINCQSNDASYGKRSEHVFKVTMPAGTSATVSLTETIASSEAVIAYFGSLGTTPQIGAYVGAPTDCDTTSGGTGAAVTLNNSAGSSAKTYWLMVYPRSARFSGGSTYTGSYDLKITMNGTSYPSASAKTGGNFDDTLLDTAISGPAPYLELSTDVTSASTISYSGTTSTATATKWSHAQLGAASGRSAGVANDAVPEHLFRFTTTTVGSVDLTVSLTGTSGQQVALSVFQSAGVPQTHSTLSPTSVQTSNNGGSSASVSGTYSGTYYVLVHGARNGQMGSYTLTIAPTTTGSVNGTPQTGGNFNNTALDTGLANLDYASIGDLGEISSLASASYAGTLSTSTPARWTASQVDANTRPSGYFAGCRYSATQSAKGYEHVFQFHLASTTNTTVTLTETSAWEGIVTVFGPYSTPFGTTSLPAGQSLNGTSATISACSTDTSTGTTSTISGSYGAGYYLVLVHSRRGDANRTGNYTLTVAPTGGFPTNTAKTFANLDVANLQPVTFGDLGTLSAASPATRSYSGALSSSTYNKWTAAQVATSGSTTGCRTDANALSYEQAFKFHLDDVSTNIVATLNTNNGGTAFNGILSIFGPLTWGSGPSSNTALTTTYGGSVATCTNVNSTSASINGSSYGAGDYLLLVQGQNTGTVGDYTLTLGRASTVVSDSSFTTLNGAGTDNLTTTTVTTGAFSTFSNLNSTSTSSGVYTSTHGDFGTVSSTQGYSWSGTLSSSSPTSPTRWTRGAIYTGSSGSGCRVNSGSGNNTYDQIFRFDTTVDVTVTLDVSGSSLNGVVSVFGPITPTFGTGTPRTQTSSRNTPAEIFNGANSGGLTDIASCDNAIGNDNTASVSAPGSTDPGTYLVLVHGYSTATISSPASQAGNPTGSYVLTVKPTNPSKLVPLGNFGTLSTSPVHYSGTLSGALNRWTSAQVGTTSDTTHCLTSGASPYQHAFRFKVPTGGGSLLATLDTTATTTFNGVLSIFGPVGTWGVGPATSDALRTYASPGTCNNSTTTTPTVVSRTLTEGDYLAVVQGNNTSVSGNYKLTLGLASTASGTNLSNSALNAGLSAPTLGDLGNVTSTGGASYTGALSSVTPRRWTAAQVEATSKTGSTNAGCRSAAVPNNSREQAFQFRLTSDLDTTATLTTSGNLNGVLTIYGPYASAVTSADVTPGSAVGVGKTVSACNAPGLNGTALLSGVWTSGYYLVLIHSSQGGTNDTGNYTLTVAPTTTAAAKTFTALDSTYNLTPYDVNYGDFGTLGSAPLYYSGTLSSGTPNKWSAAQAATANDATKGCRFNTASTSHEQAFRIYLSARSGLTATLNTNNGSNPFNGILSIYGPVASAFSAPQANTLLASGMALSKCVNANAGTASFTGGAYDPGYYYVVVHGQDTDSVGDYTLTLATDPTLQAGGNFSDSALNSGLTVFSPSTATLNGANNANGAAPYVDLGTVTATRGATTSAVALDSALKRWGYAAVATSNSPTYGCRNGPSYANSNKEHVYKFHLDSALDVVATLNTAVTSGDDVDAIVSIFGPVTGTWGTDMPVAGATPTAAFKLGASPSSTCVRASATTASTTPLSLVAGDYVVLVHAYDSGSGSGNTLGDYALTVKASPTAAVPYADFGSLTTTAKYYAGSLSSSSGNKWTSANVNPSSGTNGCRSSSSSLSAEHAFKFHLDSDGPILATLTTNPAGGTAFNGILSIFGPINSWGSGVPAVGATLTSYLSSNPSSTCINVNATSSSIATGSYAAGDYLVLVQGQTTGTVGDYSLSLALDPTRQTTGNFTNSALNAAATAPTVSTVSVSTSTLNGATLANGTAPYADLGTVTSTQGLSASSTFSDSTQKRWAHGAVVTNDSTTWGCRSSSGADSNKEHVFKVHLDSPLNIVATLNTNNGGSNGTVDAIVGIYGPIAGGTWGTQLPLAGGTSPAAAFNNGATIASSTCVRADSTTASTGAALAAGDYLVLVHAYSTATSYGNQGNTNGDYTLTIKPVARAPYADFGTLTATPKYYSGALSSSTAAKWSAANVAAYAPTNYPNGCRTGPTSNSYEHAFKFHLDTTSNVTALLNTSTGSSAFNGIVSIFGPIAGWDTFRVPSLAASTSATPHQAFNSGTTLGVSTCANVNSSSGSVTGSYAAGDYLVLVQGETTNTTGNYRLTLSATPSDFASNSYDALLNASSVAVVADFGDVTSTGYYYQGSTASATRKWSDSQLGTSTTASCRSTTSTTTRDEVREHLFKFNVTRAATIRLTLNEPDVPWNSAISLFGPSSSDPSVALPISGPLTCKPAASGDLVITQNLVVAGTYYVLVHGDIDSAAGTYRLTVQPDLIVSSPDATWASDSQNGTLNGAANLPVVADFGTIPTASTTAYSYAGDTSAAVSKWGGSDLAATTAATGLTSGANGCRAAADTGTGEHVFKFTLQGSQYINLSLNATSFDPVLSVFGPLSSSPFVDQPISSTTLSSCYHDGTHDGTASSGSASISGTWGAGTYYVIVHGHAVAEDIAGAKPAGIYTLTLDPNTAVVIASRTVTTDNAGAEAQTPSGATAINLGTVDDRVTTYSGTTSLLGTSNKWFDAQIRDAASTGTGSATGCRESATQDSGHEHLFRFVVNEAGGLPLKVQLTGALDGSISVYSSASAPAANSNVSTFVACSHRAAPASDAAIGAYTPSGGQITGTFPQGTYYAIVHGYSASAVGTYTLTVTDESMSYSNSTVAASSAADGSGPQAGVDLGTVDGHLIAYAGNTTGAANKWTQEQVSSSGNTGCRAASNDTGHEHLLKFTVGSPRRVAVRVSLPPSSTYQPVLSLLGAAAPTAGTPVSALAACTKVGSSAVADNMASSGFTASAGLITGDFAAGTYYLLVHGYQGTNNEGTYNLSVLDAAPEAMGVADSGRRITIDGNSSSIGLNQWQGSDFAPDLNGVANGGRLDGNQSSNERLYSFSVEGVAKTLTVSLTGSFDSVLSVFDTLPLAVSAGGPQVTGLLQTNRQSGLQRSITRTFAPGTYYVLVHGYRTSVAAAGTYTLAVGDDNWQSGLLGCNSRGASSKLTAMSLTPGTYYLVVKSGAGTGQVDATYQYTLNIRRTFSEPFIACDHEGFGEGSRRGYIETELQGGKTYAAVIRGVKPSDSGTYGLIIRDMTAGNVPLGCANSAGYTSAPNNPNSFTADLKGGTDYFVVVRSNGSTSVGQTTVRISHSSSAMCAFNNVTFDTVGRSTGVSPYVPAKIVTKLQPGDYYAIVKGNQNLLQSSVKIPTGSTAGIPDDRGRGRFQITFGDASLATTTSFAPPAWGTENSGGVYNKLKSQGIRVITVNSISQHGSADLYMREQSRVISDLTRAKDSNNQAIRRNIGQDGSGMGFAIVDAVAKFAEAVQMDMSVRLSRSPDDPKTVAPFGRDFMFVSRAVVDPSNGCGAPVDTDGDGILDTFRSCGPGSKPRFEIQIINPEPGDPAHPRICIGGSADGGDCTSNDDCGSNSYCSVEYPRNVPKNTKRNGGYLMTLELLGKDRLSTAAEPQVVDVIPVFIVPEDAFPDPETTFPASATYAQNVSSIGCGRWETPTWNALKWKDELPPGTAIEWGLCGRDTEEELADCGPTDFVVVARVTPGAVCTVSDDCTNAFCNNPDGGQDHGRCESAVGGSCIVDSDCGLDAVCVGTQCHYTGDPYEDGVSLRQAVERFAGKARMRVQAKLFSNADHTEAPTITRYRVDYTCTQNE